MQESGTLNSDAESDLLRDLVGAGASALRSPLPNGDETLCIRLAADPTAPQRARRAVETLGDRLNPSTVADLRTVVSELVTIFLSCPCEAPIEVQVEIGDRGIRGEVGRPENPAAQVEGPGNALRIVGALVDEWGVNPDRAMAWFRISAPD
jgi:hypothetical protein